jgi:hypothetical protein
MSVESSTPVTRSRAKCGAAELPKPPGYAVGERVVFQSDGIAGSGVIDDIMPDGSVVWVWRDDAMGRKMLFAADALSVRHEDESHKRRIRST